MNTKKTWWVGDINYKDNWQADAVCPCCGVQGLAVFYRVHQIPVHSCLMVNSVQEALDFPSGDLSLGFCLKCGSTASSVEQSFPCDKVPWARLISMPFIIDRDDNSNPIIPVKVKCADYHPCDNIWRFKTGPCSCGDGKEKPKGCVEGRDSSGCKCVERG